MNKLLEQFNWVMQQVLKLSYFEQEVICNKMQFAVEDCDGMKNLNSF